METNSSSAYGMRDVLQLHHQRDSSWMILPLTHTERGFCAFCNHELTNCLSVACQRKGKSMRKIDLKNLFTGVLLFCSAIVIGILLIFRLTHRGHIGIGPVRFGKLFIIMCALLSGSIYFFRRM